MGIRLAFASVRKWPGTPTPADSRKPSQFKRPVGLIERLETELSRFRANKATLRGYWRIQDFTRTGQIYADARPSAPGVVLEFERGSTAYTLATDRFPTWQDNAWALAHILEDIRRMERYGVTSGQLLEGFRALPPGAGGAPQAMTEDEAASILAGGDDVIASAILHDRRLVAVYAKIARAAAHPDREGGSTEAFQRVEEALRVLSAKEGD